MRRSPEPLIGGERLGASSVAVAGDDGPLVRRIESMGVAVREEHPTLTVMVCADFLDVRHAAINRSHIASGTPWMLVRPNGVQPLFGPVFRPAEQGPCWACLAYRLRGHQDVHDFVRNLSGEDAAFRPCTAEPAVLEIVYGLVATEIARWLVLGDTAPIHDRAITLDAVRLVTAHHPTMRRPQCFACGDEALHRPDRAPAPVRLRPSPKGVRNSGGLRTVSPEETLARYRHLVSPVSGVVTWLERTTDETDPWLHVHWAGSNGDEYLASARDYYRGVRRDLWVLDVTGDLGIPVFVALSRRTDSLAEDIIYGAGAHTDPRIAALRAVCELNQCLTWVPRPDGGSTRYGVDDPMCLWWWKNAKLDVPVAMEWRDRPLAETELNPVPVIA